MYSSLQRAGEIMGRRREKKEGKRGEVGVVDDSMAEWMLPMVERQDQAKADHTQTN